MLSKFIKSLSIMLPLLLIFQVSDALYGLGREFNYTLIDIENISRYVEDRIAYQRIENPINENTDNSLESLVIIKDKKMYLIKDGYDDTMAVQTNKQILEMENRLIPDMWTSKINNKPDFIQITERRVEILKKIDEGYVDTNFGAFYRNVRNKFIQQHVNVFRSLMINKKESKATVVRKPLPHRISEPDNVETKFFTSITAKSPDEKLYYAEDADGDGITETFYVSIADGFGWGFNSGPNVLLIYNLNKDPNNKEKNKEIEDLIKNLCKEALLGTPEEEKFIKDTFPNEATVNEMIDDLYKVITPDIMKKEQKK